MQIIRRKLFTPIGLALLGLVCLFAASYVQVSANVTLQSFTATATTAKIQLKWTTGSETSSNTFNLMRAESQAGPFTKITTKPGCLGGCITGAVYTHEDTTVTAGKKYYYKVEVVSGSGTQQSSIVPAQLNAPTNTPATTATKTSTPQPTATKTSTLVPGAPTYTPAPTDVPLPTATATNTLVPGAPTFTPIPPSQQTAAAVGARATATAQRIAIANPGSAPSANVPPPAAANNPAGRSTPASAGAPQPEDNWDEEPVEDVASSPARDIPWRPLATAGIMLASSALGVLGIALLGTAAILFLRARMR